MSRGQLRGVALALAASALVACSSDPPARVPIVETSRPFQSFNDEARGSAPPVAAAVDFARLLRARAEPGNWLTYYGAYDGQRFSALDQIDTGNVARLRPAWVFQYNFVGLVAGPANFAFEATPIVVDGVMFLSGPDAYVWAIDAANGKILWQYQHAVPLDTPLCCGNVNRGVAVARGKVFFVTPNGSLIALDATNGKRVWQRVFADVRAGESATLAPLVVKDKVIVGSSGGEFGVRGHIDAFDLETGRPAWRRYTVPKPGEPGSETWVGDSWQRGGGPAWITGTYDAELDTLYWSTGNPGPDFDGSVRGGENLFTDTILALDPDTGASRWHYQLTPHDVWDYDGIAENILFEQGGRKLLAHFDKNGYLFVLDRTNGRLVYVVPFGKVDWGEIDRRTGKVTVRRIPTPEGTPICPGPAGAKEWNHGSYSSATGFLYVPVVELCATFRTKNQEFAESVPYWGGDARPNRKQKQGFVKAFDPATGSEVWSWRNDHPVVASLLTTAGGLVFTGRATGEVVALDARSGAPLWEFRTGSGIRGSPISYVVGGKQHVAVPSGWGGWMKGFDPDHFGGPRSGNALFVFALP
jgi:alcohol dehydrogenase (cytochrome c)